MNEKGRMIDGRTWAWVTGMAGCWGSTKATEKELVGLLASAANRFCGCGYVGNVCACVRERERVSAYVREVRAFSFGVVCVSALSIGACTCLGVVGGDVEGLVDAQPRGAQLDPLLKCEMKMTRPEGGGVKKKEQGQQAAACASAQIMCTHVQSSDRRRRIHLLLDEEILERRLQHRAPVRLRLAFDCYCCCFAATNMHHEPLLFSPFLSYLE